MGARRRSDSRADPRVESLVPDRHGHRRPERCPQHRRHADAVRRARFVRRGAQRAAVEELGAAVRRHLRPDGQRPQRAQGVVGQVSRSDRHGHAGTEPERHGLAALHVARHQRRLRLPAGQCHVGRHEVRRRRVRAARQQRHDDSQSESVRLRASPHLSQRGHVRVRSRNRAGRARQRHLHQPAREGSDRHGGPVAGPVGQLVPAGAGDRSRCRTA